MKITAVILTFNESIHIERCIESLRGVADEIVVVDSFSSDDTVQLAENCGATVLQNPFVNQAQQFNWSLGMLGSDVDWVFRVDADEYLTDDLRHSLLELKSRGSGGVDGYFVKRRIKFLGKLIRHGGVFPVHILRLFRFGRGVSENRWMDEHIKVNGKVDLINGELIDDNRQTLTWWVDKHNKYANREVVDQLNKDYSFFVTDSVAGFSGGGQAGFKRWLKDNVYLAMPCGFRAFLYFFYRFVIRAGFLDGHEGAAFHVLQGFWYRYLVDVKLREVRRYINEAGVSPKEAVRSVLGITL